MITMVRAPCCEEGLKKGRWTDEEDEILAKYIQAKGEGCWKSVPKNAGLQRCGKSCRLRWINYLRPELKRGNITAEEEHLIIRLHASMGNRWSMIAAHLPGRTDNEIKNYWNSHLCRKHLTHHTVPNAKMAEPVGSTEVDDEWKRRRGPSRHQETSKSTTAPVEYTKMSMSMFYKEEHDVMRQDAKEESFEITDYINQEGEDNTTQGLNTGESLIFSSSQPSYFNQDHIDVLFSPEDPLNIKAKETEVHAADQKTGSKSTDASKSLSISSVGDAWDDWDWNVGDGHELIDDNEILLMLWDDDSDF